MPVTGYEEPADTLPDIIKKIEVIPLEVTENSMLKGIVQILHTLRTCRTDDGDWILQHYINSDYAGSFRTGLPLEILGKIGDCYYAFARMDVENERFVFVKFKI
jgi:hypothetical protein